ncbi:hypothetical protein ACQ4PT_051757 [Festuca glaucescens]
MSIWEHFFALNASSHFGKIHIDVLQPHKAGDKGKSVKASSGVQTSCVSNVSTNSVRPRPPCRSTAVPSIPTASVSQTAPAADVEEDAEPDEAVPHLDDEDELVFPKLVDRFSQHAMEDVYTEELSRPARFDDTDDEEKEENNDSLVAADYNGEGMPTIEWDKEDPKLTTGTIFESMRDCRNALTTYCILTQNDFVIVKSEPTRFTVKCPYERCRWRMHASTMVRSTVVQIKKNPNVHTCPLKGGKAKTKLAKTRWVADAVMDWLRENPSLGPTSLKDKIFEKYQINIPYMRMFYGKEMALDRINGP